MKALRVLALFPFLFGCGESCQEEGDPLPAPTQRVFDVRPSAIMNPPPAKKFEDRIIEVREHASNYYGSWERVIVLTPESRMEIVSDSVPGCE